MAIAVREVRPPVVARVPRWVIAAAVAAWAVAIAAWATGRGVALSHDALIHSNLPLWAALAVSLVAWQVMFAAMMVPAASPVAGLVARREERSAAAGGFLGAYALVWTAFGAAAFLGDAGLHGLVHRVPWLLGHRWAIAGAVLAAAGGFQFTRAKRACLARCRRPEERRTRAASGSGCPTAWPAWGTAGR